MIEVPPLLEIRDLVVRLETGSGRPGTTVLAGVDLDLHRGESLGIMGPSGSGKSTLLYAIGGLRPPTSGRVRLEGRDLAGLGEEELAQIRNREMGFVFQEHHLLPQCTALENVLVPTLAAGDSAAWREAAVRARGLLDRVGLGDRCGSLPGRLSGGERQRVAVVRALVNRPKLLLADEPTGSLDARTATDLGDLLVRLNAEEGVTLLVVTHAPDLARRMGRRLDLRDGRLVRPEGPA